MIGGMHEQEFMAYIIFGLVLNFLFSILFGLYLSKNIGMQEMLSSKGDKEQSLLVVYLCLCLTQKWQSPSIG